MVKHISLFVPGVEVSEYKSGERFKQYMYDKELNIVKIKPHNF